MSRLLIINANQVVTAQGNFLRGQSLSDLKVMERTAIWIEDGIIKKIGLQTDLIHLSKSAERVIDATGKIVLPGFIDSHTHLVFAGTREDEFEMRIEGKTYQEIAFNGGGINSTVKATRSFSKSELKEIAKEYLKIALAYGTTTMEVKSGYGLNRESELKILDVISELNAEQPIELIATFLGAHSIPFDQSKEAYLNEIISMLPEAATKAKFIDAFCEENYYTVEDTQKLFIEAKKFGLILKLHANQLTANAGVRLAIDLDAISVDHLERISDADIELLSNSKTCATLLPAVSFFLNDLYPPAKKLIESNAIVALASNFNPGSSMTFNMQIVMTIACTQMKLNPAQALNAATINGAYALGLNHVGTLEVGKQADLLIADVKNYQLISYFFGINHIETVIKKGEIVCTR